MEFDEIEYLENTVENPDAKKSKDKVNGSDEIGEHEEKDRGRGSKRRSDDDDDGLGRLSSRSRSRKESNKSDDEDGDDLDRSSKRSRSKKESNDHEKDRRSRYGRDREKGEKERHVSSREHRLRDKEEGGGKERNRERDREREKERDGEKKRDGNRERRENEYGRERNREEERERSKRSRNHVERHHGERGREKSRDMEVVDKDVEREHDEPRREKSRDVEGVDKDVKEGRREKEFRGRDHENRRYKEKKEAVEPEADPERDQRTVFAYQITLKAGERDVYDFFSRVGKVRDVQLIMDRNTRRSKGVGYIEFYDAISVPMAIALSGQLLLGQPVMVKPSEAEKNLVQSTVVTGGGLGPYSGGARRLYVGNLPVTIKEDQLRELFEAFGTVELVQLPTDPGTANCKGFAFIQFARLEDAKAAQSLNGELQIAGRVIKVSAVTDQAGMEDAGANIADFDDDEGNGLSLNAHSRALLMQKLDRTGTASSITGSSVVPGQVSLTVGGQPSLTGSSVTTIDTVGVPSQCLLLKNMFDPNAEAEPDFDLDIKEDCQGECAKFGSLKHIYVEKNSAGFVYLRFENIQSAIDAQRALHGRWFAGKMITATFMLQHDYEAKFPDSR